LGGLSLALPGAVSGDRAGVDWYAQRSQVTDGIAALIQAAGGRESVVECGPTAVYPSNQLSAVAYALDVRLRMEQDWSVPGMWRWAWGAAGRTPRPLVLLLHYPSAKADASIGMPLTRERVRNALPVVVSIARRDAVFSPIATAGDWAAVQVHGPTEAPCPAATRFSRTR